VGARGEDGEKGEKASQNVNVVRFLECLCLPGRAAAFVALFSQPIEMILTKMTQNAAAPPSPGYTVAYTLYCRGTVGKSTRSHGTP